MSMKPKTQGERLFLLLRDELLEASGHGHVKWSSLTSLFEQVGGRPEFGEYLRGAASIHVMRRLLRFWEAERLVTNQEAHYVKKVGAFIRDEVLSGLGNDDVFRLARAVVAAERSSNQPIPPGVRSRIVNGRNQISCYLCPEILSPTATRGQPGFFTLEHLWPQSVGGDSVEDNLLPACSRCQETTKDTMSWEWLNIQNIVLPADASAGAIASVSRKGHFARHFLQAMRVATDRRISLKEAFNSIGPMKNPVTSVPTGRPITFFDLETT